MFFKRFRRAYERVAVKLFGDFASYLETHFTDVKENMKKADMKIIFKAYLSVIFLTIFMAYSVIFACLCILFYEKHGVTISTFSVPFAVANLVALLIFLAGYYYPQARVNAKKRNIEAMLPFALNHMAAIASSGVPPYVMFRLLSNYEEYKEIAGEAKKIVRRIDLFGVDLTTAISEIAKKTPSDDLREVLDGMKVTIEEGGDVRKYLQELAREKLFDYKLKRERYSSVLSTYLSLYLSLLVVVPLIFVAFLSLFAFLPGASIAGLSVEFISNIFIYLVVPLLNTVFIMFIYISQPKL